MTCYRISEWHNYRFYECEEYSKEGACKTARNVLAPQTEMPPHRQVTVRVSLGNGVKNWQVHNFYTNFNMPVRAKVFKCPIL